MRNVLLILGLFAGISSYAADSKETATTTTATTTEVTTTEAVDPSAFGKETNEIVNNRRFSSITEVGASFITSENRFFNVYQAVGVRINPYVFIGEGLGVQAGKNKTFNIQLLTDLRVNVLNKRVTPVFLAQIGLNKVGGDVIYTTKERKMSDTQMNINLGTGILFKATDRAAFTLNGGYSLYTDFNKNQHGGFVKIGYVF